MEKINPWMAGLLTAIGLQSVVIGGFLYSARSQKEAKPATAHAAKFVAKAEKTKDPKIKRLVLVAKAAERLDIHTEQVRVKQVNRTRILEGELLAPPEATVVTAPEAGIISLPEGGSAAVPGTKLAAGQTVLRLTAASAVAAQAATVRLAVTGDRPPRRGQQAAAPARPAAQPEAMSVQAPRDAVLLRVHVQPGQTVEAGQPLFEVADFTGAVVRVPFAGDVDRVAQERPADIRLFGAKEAEGKSAKLVKASATTDPKEAARALYYKVAQGGPEWAPGQRVHVGLHLEGSGQQRLTVPYAAVVYAADGVTWVYASPEPLAYVRNRIKIDYIDGDTAVLSEGPPVGTAVVTDGAIELFGAEFKVGHGINF